MITNRFIQPIALPATDTLPANPTPGTVFLVKSTNAPYIYQMERGRGVWMPLTSRPSTQTYEVEEPSDPWVIYHDFEGPVDVTVYVDGSVHEGSPDYRVDETTGQHYVIIDFAVKVAGIAIISGVPVGYEPIYVDELPTEVQEVPAELVVWSNVLTMNNTVYVASDSIASVNIDASIMVVADRLSNVGHNSSPNPICAIRHWNGTAWNEQSLYLAGSGVEDFDTLDVGVSPNGSSIFVLGQDYSDDSYKLIVYRKTGAVWLFSETLTIPKTFPDDPTSRYEVGKNIAVTDEAIALYSYRWFDAAHPLPLPAPTVELHVFHLGLTGHYTSTTTEALVNIVGDNRNVSLGNLSVKMTSDNSRLFLSNPHSPSVDDVHGLEMGSVLEFAVSPGDLQKISEVSLDAGTYIYHPTKPKEWDVNMGAAFVVTHGGEGILALDSLGALHSFSRATGTWVHIQTIYDPTSNYVKERGCVPAYIDNVSFPNDIKLLPYNKSIAVDGDGVVYLLGQDAVSGDSVIVVLSLLPDGTMNSARAIRLTDSAYLPLSKAPSTIFALGGEGGHVLFAPTADLDMGAALVIK